MKWMMPEKTDWSKEMNAHEPTRSYGQEIYDFVKERGYNNALEIGCAWGVSALAILMAGDGELISVDPDTTNKAVQEVEINGLKDRWTYEPVKSEEFWKRNQDKYDIIYVDGSHKWPTCYEDMTEAWDRLKDGGVLICDDFTHKCNNSIDTDGTTVEYGVSFGICNLICEKKITKISSTTRLFMAYK